VYATSYRGPPESLKLKMEELKDIFLLSAMFLRIVEGNLRRYLVSVPKKNA
jgi:hypothetical protein